MTKIKICGIRRECDIEYVNRLLPEYIGFVFAGFSKRYVSPAEAALLKSKLDRRIKAVGVFVNETPENIARICSENTIDVVQIHGDEDNSFIAELRKLTDKPIIKAFRINSAEDTLRAAESEADCVLLDSGYGSGETFDHSLIDGVSRPYFLAGGITAENVGDFIEKFSPYGIDASSSLETDGFKDFNKMLAFVQAIRKDR